MAMSGTALAFKAAAHIAAASNGDDWANFLIGLIGGFESPDDIRKLIALGRAVKRHAEVSESDLQIKEQIHKEFVS